MGVQRSAGPSGVRAVFKCVCVSAHKSVCPDFVIPPNVFSKMHHNARGYDFL